MSTVRFIGCLHFGHEWMARYRGFMDSHQHDEDLITEWNKVVGKEDLTFILGDVTMETSKYYYQLDRLNGRKIVVLGNHDLHTDIRELLNYVENVAGAIDYKGYSLTHIPIHPNEISFYSGNIHAHIHHQNKLSPLTLVDRYGDLGTSSTTANKYFNVDAHLIGFKPKTLVEVDPPKITFEL